MTVAISLARAVVDELERQGHDGVAALAQAGCDPRLLDDPAARVSGTIYDRVHQRALEVSGDPAFGLHMGEHASVAAFSVLGHMATHGRTIRHVLDALFRYYRLVADIAPPHLIEEGDRARIVYEYLRSDDPRCNRVRAEFGLVRMLVIARAFLGPAALPDEAWFEHPQPDDPQYAAEYTRIFRGRERFGRPQTAVLVPRAMLDVPQTYHDETLFGLMRSQAEILLRRLGEQATVAEKIQHLIVHQYSGTRPRADAVARQLGISSRTLRRHLHDQGMTFAGVVDEAMAELAKRMLREPGTSIQQAAYRLGFSDPSSFHRAFKRWTGETPGAYVEGSGGGSHNVNK